MCEYFILVLHIFVLCFLGVLKFWKYNVHKVIDWLIDLAKLFLYEIPMQVSTSLPARKVRVPFFSLGRNLTRDVCVQTIRLPASSRERGGSGRGDGALAVLEPTDLHSYIYIFSSCLVQLFLEFFSVCLGSIFHCSLKVIFPSH